MSCRTFSTAGVVSIVLVTRVAAAQEPADYTISTVLGTGVAGYNGDNLPALEAQTKWARDAFVGPDGSIYFSDEDNARIRKLRPDGIVENVAGTGVAEYSGDGGPAKSAGISKARGVTVADDGTVYFADTWNHVIRSISPAGTIETVCGTGVEGYNGDGRLALQTQLNRPNDVALGPDGLIYFSEARNQRVRRINSSGRVETVAGNGTEAYGGDGGPAINASLQGPSGVAFGPDGTLYIADEDNHRIREVRSGTIRTVVGNGQGVLGKDNVPPLQASLKAPRDLTVGSDGTLYIADTENHRIGMVRPGGNFQVLSGNGTAGYAGDDGPAPQGLLNMPKGVAVDSEGVLYVGDTGNAVLRRIAPDLGPVEKFLRGDADLTGELNINDPVTILNSLFRDGQLECDDAADLNDDGKLNITDPIYVLRFLFLGEAGPPAPYPSCGTDSETPDTLSCAVGNACGQP